MAEEHGEERSFEEEKITIEEDLRKMIRNLDSQASMVRMSDDPSRKGFWVTIKKLGVTTTFQLQLTRILQKDREYALNAKVREALSVINRQLTRHKPKW